MKRTKIKREIRILELLKGHPHIVSLEDYVIDPSTKTPTLVLEYVEADDFKTIYPLLSKEDIKIFIY